MLHNVDVRIGGQFLWKGMPVIVKHLEGDAVTVAPIGSTHIAFGSVADLAPIPGKHQTLSQVMQISEVDWDRAVRFDEALRELPTSSDKAAATRSVAVKFGVSVRTVYNYLKKVRHERSPCALLRGKPGRSLGSRVLDDRRERIVRDEIEASYLKPERPTIPALHGAVKIACEKAGLPAPCLNTLRARVKAIDLKQRIKRREGRKRANEVCDPAAGHLLVQRPLERVEIDHTPADVILVSDTKPRIVLGRPWLTLAVDCFTRMVVGFYISFERPSSVSVALAIAHAILPKDEWLRRHGTPGTWPVFGFPESIYVDNAMEFRAIALRRGCQAYGIKLCYRPPGEPQVGGTIERLIGNMMGRVHLLPGTTHSNVQQRGDYDAEGRAQLTLREFTAWLTSEIVTNYHTTTHRGLGKPPLVAWNQAVEGMTREPPGAPLEVLANFLPGDTRVLRRTGVELHRLNYWSDAFSPFVGEKHKVVVHHFPHDLEHAYVRLPNGQLTTASVMSPKSLSNKSVIDHLMQATKDRDLENDPGLQQMRHEGYAHKDEIVSTARDAMKKSSKTELSAHPKEPSSAAALYRPSDHVLAIHIYDDMSAQ